MWIKKKIIDIQGFNFATVCLPRKHKVSPITTPRRLVQCCSWKVWVVWQPAFTSHPQCGKGWFLYFRPLDGDKTEIRGWRQGCLKDDSSRNSFDVGKSDEASLTACTGSTAGGLLIFWILRALVLTVLLNISQVEPEVRGEGSWNCISTYPWSEGDQWLSASSGVEETRRITTTTTD